MLQGKQVLKRLKMPRANVRQTISKLRLNVLSLVMAYTGVMRGLTVFSLFSVDMRLKGIFGLIFGFYWCEYQRIVNDNNSILHLSHAFILAWVSGLPKGLGERRFSLFRFHLSPFPQKRLILRLHLFTVDHILMNWKIIITTSTIIIIVIIKTPHNADATVKKNSRKSVNYWLYAVFKSWEIKFKLKIDKSSSGK